MKIVISKIKGNSLLGSFLSFLKHPEYIEEFENISKKRKFRNIFKLWSFIIVITFFVGLFLTYLMSKTGYDESQHSVVELFLNYPIIVFMFFAFVWGPVIEEITFRMGLKYSPYRLALTIIFILIILISIFVIALESIDKSFVNYFNDLLDSFGYWVIFYFILFIALGGKLLGKFFEQKLNTHRVVNYYKNNFTVIFYLSGTFFAFVHLFNFQGFKEIWYLAPLLIAPQFLLGLVLGYVRMIYGLKWSIVVHFMHNVLITVPVIIISMLSNNVLLTIERGVSGGGLNISISDSLLILLSSGFTLTLVILIIFSFINIMQEYYQKNRQL